jgi:hypothetical protein
MIAFLLHDADEQNDPDEGVYAQLDMEMSSASSAPNAANGKPERIVSG